MRDRSIRERNDLETLRFQSGVWLANGERMLSVCFFRNMSDENTRLPWLAGTAPIAVAGRGAVLASGDGAPNPRGVQESAHGARAASVAQHGGPSALRADARGAPSSI